MDQGSKSPYFATHIMTRSRVRVIKNCHEEEDQQPPAKRKCQIMVMIGPASRIRLGQSFFNRDSTNLAQALLGKILVRRLDGDGSESELLCGRIVETEAYRGLLDKAAHTFRGPTARTEAMFMKPGTIYVYFIYGMYNCMNISSAEEGGGVLLRAVEPLSGLERMAFLRQERRKRQNPEQAVLSRYQLNGIMVVDWA